MLLYKKLLLMTFGTTLVHKAFIPQCHLGSYLGVEEMCVKRLRPGGDSLLNVGVCCKLLDRQLLLNGSKEMEIIGPHSVNRTCA